MITNQQKEITQWAMEYALQKGCSSARVYMLIAHNNSFAYRNTQLDSLHQSTENKLFIELFSKGRYGSLITSRLDKKELAELIETGIASTCLLAEDPCRVLPDASRYYKANSENDLECFDDRFFQYSTNEKIDLIKSTVEEIYGTDQRIISVTASYDDYCISEYRVASNGFEAEELNSSYSLSAEVSLKTDTDARPESYWCDSRLFWTDLQKTGIASKALSRVLQKVGQTKVKSGTYNMVLDNRVSERLFFPLTRAMDGGAIQQKNTFLLNKLNRLIASPILTVEDKPHMKGNYGSRWYDREGVATTEQKIIENGVLKTYFIDTYNSLKLNMAPTISSPSVISFTLGNKNCSELIQSMQKGVWVTGFNGGNTNSTTGDFSFGVEGFWIENGMLNKPIGEMNITGNILDLWSNLIEVGNDPFPMPLSQVPSLLFADVKFSGL